MSFLVRWKFWHWTLASIALGLLFAFCYGEKDYTPRDSSARVDLKSFTEQAEGLPLADGRSPATDITLYPTHDGILLVRFNSSEESADGPVTVPRFLYTTDTNVPTQLAQLKIPFRYAWWATPLWSYTVCCAISLLIFGVAWPVLLQLLVGAGLGPKIVEPE